jgi:hypothetical protein
MNIDYESLLPIALKAMFPHGSERDIVTGKLEAYGAEIFHREQARVKLGVLYLVSQEPEKIDSFIELACTDYRDLLCAAEYPHSSRRWGLQEKEPEKYKKLRDREEKEYLLWVEKINQA